MTHASQTKGTSTMLRCPCKRALLLRSCLLGAWTAVLLMPLSAGATTSFDFVSSGEQFSIISNLLTFGNGLTISAAQVDGVSDAALIGATLQLDPIALTGSVISLPAGLHSIGIDTSIEYMLRIFQALGNGGALLMTAVYEPADFIVFGASGILSAVIENGLFDLVRTTQAVSISSTVLDDLATTLNAIDFNVTLSAAGQDLAQRIASGAPVTGAVAGSVATIPIPEPSTALLLGLGLAGLRLSAVRLARPSRFGKLPIKPTLRRIA